MSTFIDLYDNQNYVNSFFSCLQSLRYSTNSDTILYIIKNIITKDNFTAKNHPQLKKLVFYYFYLIGEVRFTNDYVILFRKELLPTIDLNALTQSIRNTTDFKQYFFLGKNEVFLNKIYDTTTYKSDFREDAVKVSNIIDFFIAFLIENFELYTLDGEHFPLFKWLITEFGEQDNYH